VTNVLAVDRAAVNGAALLWLVTCLHGCNTVCNDSYAAVMRSGTSLLLAYSDWPSQYWPRNSHFYHSTQTIQHTSCAKTRL